jgi:hypothetical protein
MAHVPRAFTKKRRCAGSYDGEKKFVPIMSHRSIGGRGQVPIGDKRLPP